MKRGQLSIEFFLIVVFVLGLASALLALSEEQMRQTDLLDRAALARSALDSIAHTANHAWLAGNGTRLYTEIFVPANSVCLLYNSTQKRLYCDVGTRCPSNSSQFCYPYSEQLLPNGISFNTTTCPPYSQLGGWYSVRLEHNGTAITAQCTRLT